MLSAQLQPHFLFNTLHAVSALIWEDQARADRLLARLSEMLRLTLRSGNRVETTLEEELALLDRYVEIQEARYGDRLRVRIEVEPAAAAGDGAASHPAAAGRERDPPRHHPADRRPDGWTSCARAGDGPAAPDRARRRRRPPDGPPAPRRRGTRRSPGRGFASSTARAQRFDLSPAAGGGAVCALTIPLRASAGAPA